MKIALTHVTLAAAATFLAGCAATENESSSTQPKAPPEYRTGSRIPVKDPQPAMSELEREQLRGLQRSRTPAKN